MSRTPEPPPRLGRNGRLAITAAVLLGLTTLLAATSLAVFTDTEANTGNTFASGGVDIAVAPATAAVTLSPVLPGSRVTAPLLVTNSGVLDLRYAITSDTTEAVLASALQLTVKSGVTDCTSTGFSATGTVLYGPGPLGGATTVPVTGSVAQGQQAGDRTLAPAASETLCFDVSLPSTTGNGVANLSTTATFTFSAEQTAGNP